MKGSNLYDLADRSIKGNNFASRMILDVMNPDLKVWKATKEGSYPWTRQIQLKRVNELTPIAENVKGFVLDRIQQSLLRSQYLHSKLTMEEISNARDLADNVPIRWVDQTWHKSPKTNGAFGLTSTTYTNGPIVSNLEAWGTAPSPNNVTISYPLFKGAKTNVMYSPTDLEAIGELGTSNINAAIYHEPAHVAQYILYPKFFGEEGAPVFTPFKDSNGNILIKVNPRTNQKFVANDVALDLAAEPTYGPGVSYSGKNHNANFVEITKDFPWNR